MRPANAAAAAITTTTPTTAFLSLCCFAAVTTVATASRPAGGTSDSAFPSRLVAIGDLHGDFAKSLRVLALAGLVHIEGAAPPPAGASDAVLDRIAVEDVSWAGGNATVVQTGDVLDRGPQSLRVHRLLERLKSGARKSGGELVTLLGNHEMINLGGVLSYVNKEEMRAFGGKQAWKDALGPSGRYGRVIAEFPTTVRRGGYVFVHAGFERAYAELGLAAVNRRVRDAVQRRAFREELLGNDGPLWTREPIQAAMHGDCSYVDDSLEALGSKEAGIRGFVVGHTVQGSQFGIWCGGRMLGADIHISRYVLRTGNVGYLELHEGAPPKPVYGQQRVAGEIDEND